LTLNRGKPKRKSIFIEYFDMHILGISCFYHDSAACLVKDGVLIAAATEERFTRKKHDWSFPVRAIEYCLKEAGINITDVDHIAFYEKPLLKFDRILSQHLEMFPKSFLPFYLALPSWFNEKLLLRRTVRKRLKYKKDIFYIPHHLAHAASAFLVSPFQEAAIITIDGVGEWQTTTISVGNGGQIRMLKELNFPHSLGLLYSAITAHLGFKVNNDEYKVMGLAAYGKPTYLQQMRRLIDVKEDGSFALNMDYFSFHRAMTMCSQKFIKEFGEPRSPESPIEERHKDLAASAQALLEDVVMKICNYAHQLTGKENICLSGGVALNSVANGKILSHTPFKDIYIQPEAGDGGGCVGAAFYAYHSILQKPRSYVQTAAYSGPGYSPQAVKEFLDANNIVYREFENENTLIKETAKLIYGDNVVGWFQGRMEWGPRALGGRSILSNPCNPKMQDILNLKVKHRERFRPFAPVVCEDDALQFFECDDPIPIPTDFMLMVYPIKEDKRKLIPAVTHVDGSGRLQTVRKEQNPRYYRLIKEFGALSGIPILINTSFNIRGEPIVCTPEDAYRCMMGTGIDYLIIENFIVRRSDNSKDRWDSEKYARD